MRGFLGLGSNVGDRLSHLRAAVSMLGERGVEVVAASSTYETEPVGEILDQPDFLNAAIEIETELDPEALLDVCKASRPSVAATSRRRATRRVRWTWMCCCSGTSSFQTARLTLPHREVTTRRFVLVPLLELDASLQLPDGTLLSEALTRLGTGERVVSVGPLTERA